MRILKIIVKDTKQGFRDKRALMLGLLLPIVMILVLGTALSGAFNSSDALKGIKIAYLIKGNSPSPILTAFKSSGEKLGMSFAQVNNGGEANKDIQNGKYVCFIKANQNNLEIYKSDLEVVKAGIVESMLNSFVQSYSTLEEISKINPEAAKKIMESSRGYQALVKNTILGASKKPSAMDYYAVTMLTFTIMYSVMASMHALSGERTLGTSNRMLCSPITKGEILIGKILGNVLFSIIQAVIIIGFSKYILKANWGNHIGVIMLIVCAAAFMSTSLGISMSFFIKNQDALRQVLNMLATVLIFLGGGWFPIGDDGILGIISKLSPLKWVNDSIFQIIYSNNFSLVGAALGVCLGISVILIMLASFSFRKEAI